MLLKWREAKLLANPGRRSWILRRCCGSLVTKAAVVGLLQWYHPGATPVGHEQSLGAQGLCLRLLVDLEGCVTLEPPWYQ